MIFLRERNRRLFLRVGILVWLILLFLLFIFQLPDDRLHLVFCDVGQGDAIVVRYKNNQVLVDGGPPGKEGNLLRCLSGQMAFGDRTIELAINTHPDEDHFGGLEEVFRRFKVNTFLTNGDDNLESWRYQELKRIISEQKIYTRLTGFGDILKIGNLYIDILSSEPKNKNDQKTLQEDFEKEGNSRSIVLKLKFGEFDALLTGDLPSEQEQILVWRKILTPSKVLKIAHHGSKSSTSDELLAVAKPQLAIISVGENKFGHPAKEVLEKLGRFGIKYLRTDEAGTIEIVSDGKNWGLKK